MLKKKNELKKQQVLKVHPYTIRKRTRKKNKDDSYVYYTTTCPWLNSEPRTHTERELINKLYAYYFGDEENCFSFKTVFNKALDEKIRTENPKEKTIRDITNSYNAFITDEFGKQDIRNITPSQVKEYIQTTTQKLSLTKKRFYKFKGLLNLVFEYAIDGERRYIDVNPVPHSNKAFKKNLRPTDNSPETKAFQPHEVDLIRNTLWERISKTSYDIFGYAILFSSYTGIRLGEIPSLI